MKKKAISYLLVVTMLLTMLIAGTIVASAASVTVEFDLTKGNVVINNDTYSGYNSSGNLITGSHDSDNKYIVNGKSTNTSNMITLSGDGLKCDLTLNDVKRSSKSIGLSIASTDGQNKDVVVRLKGTNTLGQLYYTGNSKLKITSANGDGSTSGKLIATAGEDWSAAIGGTDGDESFSGLTIAGGTIIAEATHGAAIGGGGNGSAIVTITGGNVTATNSGTSAAIGGGGGDSGRGGDAEITIEGGTVTAKCTGDGVAIGGGGSKQHGTVGTATVKLLGGTITASSSQYAISGGYSQKDSKYNTTKVTISDSVRYDARINSNASVTGNKQYVFDLAKDNVVFNGNSFSGKNSEGSAITGTHSEGNRYFVRQSNNTVATANSIQLKNKITGKVNIEIDGINSSAVNSISIPASNGEEKHVVLSLKNDNRINNILYYTIPNETSKKGEQSASTLKITSASGDGSEAGKLTVIPAKGSGDEDGSVHYNAAIGGTDSKSGVTGLHIAGGTLIVEADTSNDCSAIGGGGNGYAEILITGGYINAKNASTGATIGGGVGYTAPGSGCDVVIEGGTIVAENKGKHKKAYINDDLMCYGVAIGGGSSYKQSSAGDIANVTIKGGNVTAIVPDGQTAIGAGNSNKSDAGEANVTIIDGTVNCTGGIGGGSTIVGNGGNGTLIVSGGNLTVKGFIGGGTTKNGEKGGTATVKIFGKKTVVKAASIGGGVAEKENVVSRAKVRIEGGDIQAQILMEGKGSTFDMSGGTINNSKAQTEGYIFKKENGGAVYIANGEAKMTGGTITNCSSTSGLGGALYVTGGSFDLSGAGTIQDCSAAKGGAAYVSGGSVSISGGTIKDCNSATGQGGAIYVTGGKFTMSAGEINKCAANEGGAVYVSGAGGVAISGGKIENCEAIDGGAVYVSGGSASISGGTITNNTSKGNGGGVYVSGGNATMADGEMTNNVSANNGGAVYVFGGNFEMTGGTFSENIASNGGAVYVSGGNFDMISGKMDNNGANKGDGQITKYGGAVYVDGGNITVGVNGCEGGAENTNHTVVGTIDGLDCKTLTHPIITNNKAQYGGAFAVRGSNDSDGKATSGIVSVYCSFIDNNNADNEGTGHNIFMDGGGLVHYLNSATIGEDSNHEIVTIGGQLKVENAGQIVEIKLVYDSNATSFTTQWIGEAPEGYHINLPYCPNSWQEEQAKPDNGNKAFVGWSVVPITSSLEKEVRNKDGYMPIGKAIKVVGDADGKMTFYAVWAPKENNISYAYSLDGEKVIAKDADGNALTAAALGIQSNGTDDYSRYTYENVSYNRGVPEPSKPGYVFDGWLIYADTNKIANWNADPVEKWGETPVKYISSDAVTGVSNIQQPTTEIWNGKIDRNFGDITLVAVFRPSIADIKIDKEGADLALDPNATFIYEITGDPLEEGKPNFTMEVVVLGNEDITVKGLPVGNYTVVEKTDWSWRYDIKANGIKLENATAIADKAPANGVNFDLTNPETLVEVKFENERNLPYWLSGNASCENWWGGTEMSPIAIRNVKH